MSHEQFLQHLDETFKLALAKEIDLNQLAGDIVNKKVTLPQAAEITPDQFAQKLIQKHLDLHHTVEVEEDQLAVVIKKVVAQNQDAAAKYKAGKTQVLGFLMGQVMSQLDEKPDPAQIRTALIKALK